MYKINYLHYKIASFAVQKHIDTPIHLWHNLVPYSGETKLVPGSKTVHLIEPKTSKEVADRSMLLYYHAPFWNICRSNHKSEDLTKKLKGRTEKRRDLAPTTCDGKFSLRIWHQTLFFIKVNLKVNRGVIIFLCSFVCLSFNEDIKAFVMPRDCKSSIFPPQEPEN